MRTRLLLLSGLFGVALVAGCGGSNQTGTMEARAPQLAASVILTAAQPSVKVEDYEDVVQQIYIAYFGRPADAGGLAYFEAQFLNAHAPTTLAALIQAYNTNPAIKGLIDSFSTSAESQALYPGDNAEFVSAIYRNLFNRTADDGGKTYWAPLIDSGALTRSLAALSIMGGAQSTDAAVIKNKTTVARLFTGALDNEAKAKAYSGLDANIVVRTMLGTVTDSTDLLVFGSKISATILALAKTGPVAAPIALPVVRFFSPTSATTGQYTIFTFTGTDLVGGMSASLDGCLGITELTGGTSTIRQFGCTPLLSGPSYWVIRASVGGPVVGNFSVAVASPVISTGPKQCWVNGYYRASGTYVRGYWRSC